MLPLLQETMARIPVEPPLGGPVWTIVIPALLLLFTAVATAMLYRRFAGK